jgi:hypothetical protein
VAYPAKSTASASADVGNTAASARTAAALRICAGHQEWRNEESQCCNAKGERKSA